MNLEDHLAVPYKLIVYSAPGPDGEWHRYAAYPELGCVSQGETPMEAMDRLEEQRIRLIVERLQTGEPIPVPRPPLRSLAAALDAERLAFARWLVDTQRLNET
jgi:predicted RNase H-like HicB family nuclease